LTARPTRFARIAYTLVWPGLGHFLDGRGRRGALFALWGLGITVAFIPAFAFPRPLLFLELAAVAGLATADVLRAPRSVV
jgi:hypothetical protein